MNTNSGPGSSQPDPYYNRHLRGTAAHRFRNYFAFGVLGVSAIFGVAFHFLPPMQKFGKKVEDGAFNDNEETLSRRGLFRENLRTSADSIRKVLEDDMKPVPHGTSGS